ncbi:unnamed protein product [Paramecium sonneborni]|uniref:B30.2/SPRY domain-containing protein n=2 Tax=Paramecium sonneborni TaxID=65129 RepID=A0A8S1MUN7_9CILI|nr:unnamed protein product [Paramecium sonneborni]
MEYPDGYLLPLFSWDPQRTSTKLKLCQDQLQVIATDGSGFKSAIGDQEFTPGYKYYYEIKILKGSLIKIGVCTKNGLFQDQAFSDNEEGWAIYNGELRHNSNSSGNKYGKQYKKGDIIGVMLNMIDGQLSFSINGENQGIAFESKELKEIPLYAAIAPIYKEDGIELLMAVRED